MSPSAHDFVLAAAPVVPAVMESDYQIVLTSLTLGKVLGVAVVPCLNLRRLERVYQRPMQSHNGVGMEPALLKALGQELAAFLLPPAVTTPLCAELTRQPASTIHLRLAMEEAALAALPWEYLFLDALPPLQTDADFLCKNPSLHLSRRSSPPREITAQPTGAIRILIAWADPCSPAYPPLGFVQQEAKDLQRLLEDASERDRFQVEVLAHATPGGLQKKLDDWHPHILHFIGHGDHQSGAGVLILEGEKIKTATEVSEEMLAEWLDYAAFRLLVLSACRTASLGYTLTQSGVPAVIAMQALWPDKLAVVFARILYSALVAGNPLEEALCQARQVIQGKEWGIPALFLAGDSSHLLEICGPTPTNLSYPTNPRFVGRDSVMKSIRNLLQSSDVNRVALVGMGGIGKTQLTVEYAQRSLADYPGGVFWLEAADAASLLTSYADLGHFFSIPPGSENPAEQVRIRLQQQRMPTLLIYNDLTGQIEPSRLPAVGACKILATTREGYLADSWFQKIEIPTLDEDAALQLLQTHKTAKSPAEHAAARAIVDRIGSLPLALALVAYHMQRHDSFAEYLERLEADPLETLKKARDRFVNLTGHDGSLFDTLNISYQKLDRASAHLLQTASCFAMNEISLDLLQLASGLSARHTFREALDELEAYCLVGRNGNRSIRLHALVRDFALDQAGESRIALVDRIARLLTQRLCAANARMDWKEIHQEQEHCRALVEFCEKYELLEPLCDLMAAMGGYLFQHADLAMAREYYTRCLQIARVRCGARSEAAAYLTMRLAHTLLHQGASTAAREMGEAALTMATSLWKAEASELADYYNDMGYILRRTQKLKEALWHYERALILCKQEAGDLYASIANNIGALHEEFGNLALARIYMERAREIDAALFGLHHPKTAIRLNNIGRITLTEGRATEALQLHLQALEINRATYEKNHPDIAACYYYLGQAQVKLQQYAPAKQHYQQSLEIYEYFYGSDHKTSRTVRNLLAQIP